MDKVKIIMFCMLDLYRWFVYVNCEREEATQEPATPNPAGHRVQSSQMIEKEHLLSSKPSNPELARVKGEELNEERDD